MPQKLVGSIDNCPHLLLAQVSVPGFEKKPPYDMRRAHLRHDDASIEIVGGETILLETGSGDKEAQC